MNSKHILLAIVTLVVSNIKSQPGVFQPGDYRDGAYDKWSNMNKEHRRSIPYTHLREGDVTWEKRVWRELDMREKQNQQLYFPVEIINGRTSFLQVLFKYILTGEIIAFKDDQLLLPLEPSEIRNKIVKIDTVIIKGVDAAGNETEDPAAVRDSTWMFKEFRRLQLKEDWFFDKQKSKLEVRIIAMGVWTYDEDKQAPKEQFYVYFPACREFFARHEVYNTKNDAERRTFEDIFWKRQFSSVAIKESNVFDRGIIEYSKGIDALLESDRIKGDIFKWEHDLWHF
jgi:gliding motility associated protien GldN